MSRGKPTDQSSTYGKNGFPASADKGVDGNYNNVMGDTPDKFCAHTNSEVRPWWRVDLQAEYDINRVKIWNRQDCCGERLLPLQIETSTDGNSWSQCATLGGTGVAGQVYAIDCVATGRFVRITLIKDTAELLTLCEVEVWGTESSGYGGEW